MGTERQLAILKTPQAFLYEEDGTIADEILSGWAVEVEGEEKNGRVPVMTHYGYHGLVNPNCLLPVRKEELKERASEEMLVVTKRMADVLSEPRVQGALLETLSRGSFVTALGTKEDYTRVKTASGCEGYLASCGLAKRKDSDGYLLAKDSERDGWFLRQKRDITRDDITEAALAYMGVQYRWGGHSGDGIDCSGLVFMAYLLNGVLIYRDAGILPEYPVHKIPWDAKQPGDLMLMKGHVAMYLGDNRYLHSTGYARDHGVVFGGLNPEDPLYRKDLEGKWLQAGSIFDEGGEK